MENKITQAVILSAGMGTRLRPLTNTLSKVMVPLAGKPLLEHHFEQFKRHGVTEFFVNLHYLPDTIRGYFNEGSKWGIRIHYTFEPVILGTAGGIKNFEGQTKENFFVIYGDVFSLVDYSRMSSVFFEKKNAIGMEIVGDTDHPQDSDLVEVGRGFEFLKIYQKPHQLLTAACKAMRGVYLFNAKIFNYIPKNIYYEIDHQLLPDILDKGEKFYGYETKDYLKDIGTPARYQEVQGFLKKNTRTD